ncbi:hypothetical protein VCHENC02_5069B, partial [Vibrio harveyi]
HSLDAALFLHRC